MNEVSAYGSKAHIAELAVHGGWTAKNKARRRAFTPLERTQPPALPRAEFATFDSHRQKALDEMATNYDNGRLPADPGRFARMLFHGHYPFYDTYHPSDKNLPIK